MTNNNNNKMKNGTLVKLTRPEQGEENLIYVVTNYNEITQRVIIKSTNLPLNIKPSELVSINDITIIR